MRVVGRSEELRRKLESIVIPGVRDVLIGFSTDEKRPSSALAYGLDLARRAGAHATIVALSSELMAPYSVVSSMGARLVAEENERRRSGAQDAAESARERANLLGVPCTAEAAHLTLDHAAARFRAHARVHDFAVMDANADRMSFEGAVVEDTLFKSGRPVLLVPEGREAFGLDHVMAAWDGGVPAARALNEALPLLGAAKSVDLVSVAEAGKKDVLPGADVAPHLARHGIQAALVQLEAARSGAVGALREQAQARPTDLIVMGAYGHSWWREVVLGGVTQSFLGEPPAPLFLCH